MAVALNSKVFRCNLVNNLLNVWINVLSTIYIRPCSENQPLSSGNLALVAVRLQDCQKDLKTCSLSHWLLQVGVHRVIQKISGDYHTQDHKKYRGLNKWVNTFQLCLCVNSWATVSCRGVHCPSACQLTSETAA